MDVLFFDKPYLNLMRFGNEIAAQIKSLQSGIRIGGMFCTDKPNNPIDIETLNLDEIFYRADVKDVDAFLVGKGVRLIVFTIYRVPDLEIILHAKHLGIKTVMLQEGVIFDGTNIDGVSAKNITASLGSLPKVFWYLRTLKHMCKYDSLSYLKFLTDMCNVKTKLPIYVMKAFSVPLICDYVFIMGEHWRSYFQEVHGYENDRILLMGDHDLDGLNLSNPPEQAICYIANVLVEDGTIQKAEFLKFIESLAESLSNAPKIYVKLHPRSDKSLFAALEEKGAFFLRSEPLPNCAAYIGHRSTLLGRALYVTDGLLIWRFPSEEICFYERYAEAVCTTDQELFEAARSLNYEKVTNEKRKDIANLYLYVPDGAFFHIAMGIIDFYQNGLIDPDKVCPSESVA